MSHRSPSLRLPPVLLLACALAACTAAPPGPPEQVGQELVAHLDEGREQKAQHLFERVEGDARYTERLYPLLYQAARERYSGGQPELSARILEFMSGRYPDATGVREGLVYALFLERAGSLNPDPALLEDLTDAVAALRERVPVEVLPPWIDLVETQLAIDRGRTAEAREALARLLARWDGQPEALAVYVDDLERHLAGGATSGGTR